MLGRDTRNPHDEGPSLRERMFAGHVQEERRVSAWIGSSIVIKGDLTSSEDMTIAGEIEGNVAVPQHTVVIAPQARIRGEIVARAVVVHGTVKGTINARARVEVGDTGSVEGDILAPRIAVSEGAVLQGRIGMATPSPAPS